MKDLFACLACFHRVFGATGALSHLADLVPCLRSESKNEETELRSLTQLTRAAGGLLVA